MNARIRAWKYQNEFTGNSGVKWIPQAVLLNESATVETFMSRLRQQLGDTKPSMIVFDTLARCSVGGGRKQQ